LGVVVLFVVSTVHSNNAAPKQKDPVRIFTAAQKLEGYARANNQCEFESMIFKRCTKTASHADHWYPWSKGGNTSMMNFVAACPRCNTSKGAKVPGQFSTWRLENRRRKYFPNGVPVTAGQRL
jgi:5-methylcytosine-specific restriction endonuclease McrA